MITKLVNILGLLSAGTAAVRADIDCSDFSVGKCNTNQENIIDTKKIPENLDFGISVDTCQKICTSIAGCNYMSYIESTRDCTLMNYDIHSGYLSCCDLISGPSPMLERWAEVGFIAGHWCCIQSRALDFQRTYVDNLCEFRSAKASKCTGIDHRNQAILNVAQQENLKLIKEND